MSTKLAGPGLWGGIECTFNRVHDMFYDQMSWSGHRDRSGEDLARIAALGIRTLRTALPWELFTATGSWTFGDTMLAEMQRLQMQPILGLVHHGSGPLSTDLLDPKFPEELAAYAAQVARRYPHVLDYTPVNEPQTTGRFACLYGVWYPHHRSMGSYIRALHNEMKAIVLAMRAIREVQPAARLIHTEDGGRTFATPPLESYRVAREHRRWLGTDLLCGRITREHPLFGFLQQHGLSEAEILWFAENSCPPSVLGLNYYVTSDRLLDHRLELYPGRAGGDTGDEPLVDVEAVRVRSEPLTGVGAILREAWDRYHLPVAITEAHLGAGPLDQARWLAEVWREASAACSDGVDVRAVTVWALLGSYNWCHLCAMDAGTYEPSVFDLTSGEPMPTSLAHLVYCLAHGLPPDPAVFGPGWWQSPDRLIFPPYIQESETGKSEIGEGEAGPLRNLVEDAQPREALAS